MEPRINPTKEQLKEFFDTIDKQFEGMSIPKSIDSEKVMSIWRKSMKELFNEMKGFNIIQYIAWETIAISYLQVQTNLMMYSIQAEKEKLASSFRGDIDKSFFEILTEKINDDFENDMKTLNEFAKIMKSKKKEKRIKRKKK